MLKKLGLAISVFAFVVGATSVSNAKPLGACKACHFFDKGPEVKKSNLGPGLKGVVGRKISIDTTKFTGPSADQIVGDTWTEANLNVWLTKPKAVKPKTKMTYKQKKEKKRAKIIAALKEL